jgi:hypothetical protein
MKGGNLCIEEIVRFRHVGTGKFLAISEEDGITPLLSNTSNNMSTLFKCKSEMSNKQPTKFLDADGDGFKDMKLIANNQKIMIQSWLNEKYLQLDGDIM